MGKVGRVYVDLKLYLMVSSLYVRTLTKPSVRVLLDHLLIKLI